MRIMSEEYDEAMLPGAMVSWLCDALEVERCSLMSVDATQETLEITAQCGMENAMMDRVRVRIGQGVAGWVAQHRRPLLVRMPEQANVTPELQAMEYNSPSFISVPVVYNGRLYGVLNLSNKRDGELFDEIDLDRASLAGSVLAVRLASQQTARRAAAWA
jgi:signal transduction protein with GAF and PtsI domain